MDETKPTTPPAWATGKCRTCGAPIKWGKFASGKFMCVEPNTNSNGNLDIANDEGGTVILKPVPIGLGFWVSHVTTCPTGKPKKRGKLFE